MKTIETFEDGSTITTDSETGEMSVFGAMANKEYCRRVTVRFDDNGPDWCVVKYCSNIDGSIKCELVRAKNTNPITIESFGLWRFGVTTEREPGFIRWCASRERATELFMSECVIGTGGFGSAVTA